MKFVSVLFLLSILFFGTSVEAVVQKKVTQKKHQTTSVKKKPLIKKTKKPIRKKQIIKRRYYRIPENSAPSGYDTFTMPTNKEYGFAYPYRFNIQVEPGHSDRFQIQDSVTKQSIHFQYAPLPEFTESKDAFESYIISVYPEKADNFKDISEIYGHEVGKEYSSKGKNIHVFVSGPFIIDISTQSTNSYIVSQYKQIVKSFGKIEL